LAGDCTGHQGREIAGVDSLNAKDNNGKHGGQTGKETWGSSLDDGEGVAAMGSRLESCMTVEFRRLWHESSTAALRQGDLWVRRPLGSLLYLC